MSYSVGTVQQDNDGFGFNVTFASNPARFVTFSFDDIKTAEAMAMKMKKIIEVCVSLKVN
jgi:hypothetical protein